MVAEIEKMNFSKQVFGQSGEQIAALFFEEKGYFVIDRNWRCKTGEIDLVVRKDDEWRFIEVKTRGSNRYGQPEESLTPRKQDHFYKAIQWYVLDKNIGSQDIHADVLAILINDRDFDIRWLPDAS